MNSLEIFLDESGDITRDRPMNISGVALLCRGDEERTAFHADYFNRLTAAGLTAGLCDAIAANSLDAETVANTVSVPPDFLPKRPADGDWDRFWEKVTTAARLAETCANAAGVDLIAFSLEFPRSTNRRWGSADVCMDLLLDRPYSECLKDVLELLLFETPRIRNAITSGNGCSLAFDLPTRTLYSPTEDQEQLKTVQSMWSDWGVRARPETGWQTGAPQVAANTMEPADAIEILTSALSRRKERSTKVLVERARCCRLISWSQWQYPNAEDDRKRCNKRYWAVRDNLRPKQIHYLADFLSNAVFNRRINPSDNPYRVWFDRGFALSSVDDAADEWLDAVRGFANGDRVGALQGVVRICEKKGHHQTKTYQFFRRSAQAWPTKLKGLELKRLFAEADIMADSPSANAR